MLRTLSNILYQCKVPSGHFVCVTAEQNGFALWEPERSNPHWFDLKYEAIEAGVGLAIALRTEDPEFSIEHYRAHCSRHWRNPCDEQACVHEGERRRDEVPEQTRTGGFVTPVRDRSSKGG